MVGRAAAILAGAIPFTARLDDEIAQRATRKVTLGYVVTGDRSADEASRLGLAGLSRVLALRTSVEPGDPIGVNVVTDEIAFYPVLYWPVLPTAQPLREETLAKMGYNNGAGPADQRTCTKMANRFERWLEHHAGGHGLESDLRVTPDGRFV